MSIEPNKLEGAFYAYMRRVGQVDSEWNREVLGFYIPYFARCHHVLDVGCGEGQFIELLRAVGVEAVGIDTDSQMVKACRAKGLDVIQADLFEYLPPRQGQFDGIFSSNLIEHLSAGDAQRFTAMALQALSPGGVFLVATPNPASPIVHLHEFWRDATHVRLYSRSLLEFLLDWAGFEQIDSGENPHTRWMPPPAMQQTARLLAENSSRHAQIRWDPASLQLREPTPAPDHGPDHARGKVGFVPVEREKSFVRRLASSLRRHLARFLAERVLFEEFAMLSRGLADLDHALSAKFAQVADSYVAAHQIEHTLYEAVCEMPGRPREIFVQGIRPPLGNARAE